MNYLQIILKTWKFFSTADQTLFQEVFGETIGTHLWRKYQSEFGTDEVQLRSVHKFLSLLDLDNQGKFEKYLQVYTK